MLTASTVKRRLKELERIPTRTNRREHERLRAILMYLESNPSEEYLYRKLEELEEAVRKALLDYQEWRVNTPETRGMSDIEARQLHAKTFFLPDKRRHIKTIKTILFT